MTIENRVNNKISDSEAGNSTAIFRAIIKTSTAGQGNYKTIL
jgi:hypothetical protein